MLQSANQVLYYILTIPHYLIIKVLKLGAINNYRGTVYFINSSATGNVAFGNYSGGAIGNNGGNVYIVNSLFAHNYRRTTGSVTNPTGYVLDDFQPFFLRRNSNLLFYLSCCFTSKFRELTPEMFNILELVMDQITRYFLEDYFLELRIRTVLKSEIRFIDHFIMTIKGL